jgi:hypothetical protein
VPTGSSNTRDAAEVAATSSAPATCVAAISHQDAARPVGRDGCGDVAARGSACGAGLTAGVPQDAERYRTSVGS